MVRKFRVGCRGCGAVGWCFCGARVCSCQGGSAFQSAQKRP